MKLYYDNTNSSFCLNKTSICDCVFEINDMNRRVGWKEGKNPVIRKGPFEISIQTNFYPKFPNREELIVNIAVNGILLIPISKACRKADVLYHFSKHEIAFFQYGAGNNDGREPATLVQLRDDINWERSLKEICNICNNYKNWVVSQTELLLSILLEQKKTSFNDIATLIDLVRVYDDIVPEIIPIYKDFIDSRCMSSMRKLLDYIEGHINDKHLKTCDMNAKRKNGDLIWSYIKDFYMRK